MEDEKADAQPETAGSTSLDPEKPPQEDEDIAKDPDTDHGQMGEVEGEAPSLPPLELASMSLSLIASTPSPPVRHFVAYAMLKSFISQYFYLPVVFSLFF